jgi:hypothetical protein
MLQLTAAANVVPTSLILVTLMMSAIRFPEASSPIRATRLYNPEYGVLLPLICSLKIKYK